MQITNYIKVRLIYKKGDVSLQNLSFKDSYLDP